MDSVSIEIRQGECVGLVGANGAGKTTLFNVLSGVTMPDSGTMSLLSKPLPPGRAEIRSSLGLSRTFQEVRLFWDMTVSENVLIGRRNRKREALLRSLLGLSESRDHESDQAEALAALRIFGLEDCGQRLARSLSFGQMKMVELLRALTSRPKILLLDEPTAGLNETTRTTVFKLLAKKRSRGLTVFLIEHDPHVLRELCSRVLLMHEGQILLDGPPEDVVNAAATLPDDPPRARPAIDNQNPENS